MALFIQQETSLYLLLKTCILNKTLVLHCCKCRLTFKYVHIMHRGKISILYIHTILKPILSLSQHNDEAGKADAAYDQGHGCKPIQHNCNSSCDECTAS